MNQNQRLLDLPWSSFLCGGSHNVTEPEAQRMGKIITALIREHGTALKVVNMEIIAAHEEVERLLQET